MVAVTKKSKRMEGRNMEQILVVEDDWELNHGICWQLQKEAYDTKAAYCIAKAQTLLRKETFRLVLLDVNLPDGEGFSVLQWMNRENLHIPVLFLTARDLEEDALLGYEQIGRAHV